MTAADSRGSVRRDDDNRVTTPLSAFLGRSHRVTPSVPSSDSTRVSVASRDVRVAYAFRPSVLDRALARRGR